MDVDVTANGKTQKVKANGKLVLRSLWVSTKGNVGVKMVTQINEMLKKQGKPPFPTH